MVFAMSFVVFVIFVFHLNVPGYHRPLARPIYEFLCAPLCLCGVSTGSEIDGDIEILDLLPQGLP